MLNIRFIIKMLGMMFILETLFMLAATAVAFLYEGNDFYPLLQSSGIMFGTGVLFMLIGLRANEHTAGRREGMLTVTLTWALFSLLGMLPFYLGGYIDNVTDAYFETMSGFTTTGSTILTDIEALPHGILFWRSLTQWQGGIGMIVFTVATKNASIAYWDSAYIEYIITIFMFIGATNITLIYFFFNGRPKKLFADEETRWFFWFVLIITAISTVWIMYKGIVDDFGTAFRQTVFQVVTLVSTCGFATVDYIPWGPFFWLLALVLMVVCGCAGSTCGGLKMGRFVILTKNLFNEFKKQTHPHAIIPVRMNGHAVSGDIVHRVLAFAFAYIALIFVSCMVLMIDGVGFEETIGATISSISNVGPGLGSLGPVGNYADVPVVSKWFLSFLMMVGRLEIFTVLTILLPGFWKQ